MKPFSREELISYYDELSEEQQIIISKQLRHQADSQEEDLKKRRGWGRNQDHKAVGRLVFEYEDKKNQPIPMHNVEVELWDKDIGNPDDFLGQSKTDTNGNFEIWYDPADAGKRDLPDLDLRVFELHHRFDRTGNVSNRKRLIYTISGDKNVTVKEYDFGECRIPYWEYDDETGTPRVLITDEGNPPQSYGPGRSLVMVKALAPIELKKRRHISKAKRKSATITAKAVQEAYPENLTREMEREKAGSSRSDTFFADCLLNGMTASIMDRDPGNLDYYWIHYHWNSYEQDGIYAVPNIDIKFELQDDTLLPKEITIHLREKGVTQPNAPLTKYAVTPGDGSTWEMGEPFCNSRKQLCSGQ